MRTCTKCKVEQPLENFGSKNKAKGQRNSWCRSCMADYQRSHYLENKAMYKARSAQRGRRLASERARLLIDFFAEHPCVDCGERDPVVLEFDHVRDKTFDIGQAIGAASWVRIVREMQKCEVVCGNCHARRTARRANTIRWQVATGQLWLDDFDPTPLLDRCP